MWHTIKTFYFLCDKREHKSREYEREQDNINDKIRIFWRVLFSSILTMIVIVIITIIVNNSQMQFAFRCIYVAGVISSTDNIETHKYFFQSNYYVPSFSIKEMDEWIFYITFLEKDRKYHGHCCRFPVMLIGQSVIAQYGAHCVVLIFLIFWQIRGTM